MGTEVALLPGDHLDALQARNLQVAIEKLIPGTVAQARASQGTWVIDVADANTGVKTKQVLRINIDVLEYLVQQSRFLGSRP